MLFRGGALLHWRVALRKESVDRNSFAFLYSTTETSSLSARRAWIEICRFGAYPADGSSLSARRAWIEICNLNRAHGAAHVALRKESVDRNTNMMESSRAANWSLSARRAWIEMSRAPVPHLPMASLSARRAWIEISIFRLVTLTGCGRSPQGERG